MSSSKDYVSGEGGVKTPDDYRKDGERQQVVLAWALQRISELELENARLRGEKSK